MERGERCDDVSRERVLVAMSGGVDSSVAALLLHDAGYDTAGVTLRLFANEAVGISNAGSCCSLDDVQDAKFVASDLGIHHYVFNFGSLFSREVMDRFCQSYLCGQTPNPCIDCNRFIKFDALQRRRRELGYDYVATGHYARRAYDASAGRYLLKRARDASKDQSYVLYHLTQDQLAHMLFPLGDLEKKDVRALARRNGFVNAEKAESQDICFVPDGDYAGFIERYTEARLEPGPIVSEDGRVLGMHRGLAAYTIGQRKGIGLAADRPLYVLRKDVASNALVAGSRERLLVRDVTARDVNLIAYAAQDVVGRRIRVEAKTGYRHAAAPGWAFFPEGGTMTVVFDEPVVAPAAGQALVAYQGDVVVGGGTVQSAILPDDTRRCE